MIIKVYLKKGLWSLILFPTFSEWYNRRILVFFHNYSSITSLFMSDFILDIKQTSWYCLSLTPSLQYLVGKSRGGGETWDTSGPLTSLSRTQTEERGLYRWDRIFVVEYSIDWLKVVIFPLYSVREILGSDLVLNSFLGVWDGVKL